MPNVPNAHWWQVKHLQQHIKQSLGGILQGTFWTGASSPMPIFIDPLNTYVDTEVEIGQKTVIEPNVWIMGKTVIGKNCHIGFGSVIIDSILGNDVKILGGRVERSQVDWNAIIGYTAQLKRTHFGENSKMMHHGYLGDAVVGKNVNIGAGVITANYDGREKQKTIIGDGAFIGTNVCLVAPITIPDGAMIAAGSTVTGKDEIRPYGLIVARAKAHLSQSKVVKHDETGWHLEERSQKQQEESE